ncbi:MAG: hypothetical protein ACM3ZR_14105 [Pseudomonadota bacterium]
MYTEINRKLEEAQQGIRSLEKIDSMLLSLREEKRSVKSRLYDLKERLDKENVDVEKLEKKSLAFIFHSILGSYEERLDKEKGEALAAKLKYDQAARDLEAVESEISRLDTERTKYTGCKNSYDRLYAEKKDVLMKSDPEKAQTILELTRQLNNSKSTLKEIGEAASAGRNVIKSLDSALGSLESAEGWGVWDMLGGGLISDLAKHSRIDDARYDVGQAQDLLIRFRTELSDIQISEDISVETGGFAKFADFFFDGLIADWFMQSRIQNSHSSIFDTKCRVQGVLDKLERLYEQEASNVEKLEIGLSEFVTRA